MADPAKKPAVDLAVVFGGAPKKGKPMMGGGDEMASSPENDKPEEDSDEVPPEFEAGISEARLNEPGLAEDPERMQALWRAVKACMGSY